jgi:hypothetical protein
LMELLELYLHVEWRQAEYDFDCDCYYLDDWS